MTTWNDILHSWGLKEPESGRIDRAASVVLTKQTAVGPTTFLAGGHHQVRYGEVYPSGFKADCGCQDFRTRQEALGIACKHIVRLAQYVEKNGPATATPPFTVPPIEKPGAPTKKPTTTPAPTLAPSPAPKSVKVGKVFVGPQPGLIYSGLGLGKVVLLAGPTGTGKTLAVEEVVQFMGLPMFRIEGKEGMLDVDFLGNIVPRATERVWQNGPLAEAMVAAQDKKVVLFLDELTRFPREQINLLIGFLNRKSGDICRQEGVSVEGDGPFYVARVPQDNGKIFICPCSNLKIVAAANFGRDYAVYPLDPALRRRFTMVVEFDYPAAQSETALLMKATGVNETVAKALVAVAVESRRVHENGDLPGQIDTASLLEWGHKCAEFGVRTSNDVMRMAEMTWADLVCGRTADGRLDQGHFKAMTDHIEALGTLGKGSTTSYTVKTADGKEILVEM